MMHLFHNLRGAFLASLTLWKGLEKKLHSLARFLNSKNNLVRLRRTCFRGQEAMYEKLFGVVPVWAEWRWSSIVKTLHALLPLQAPLQQNWSYQKYVQGGAEEAPIDAEWGSRGC